MPQLNQLLLMFKLPTICLENILGPTRKQLGSVFLIAIQIIGPLSVVILWIGHELPIRSRKTQALEYPVSNCEIPQGIPVAANSSIILPSVWFLIVYQGSFEQDSWFMQVFRTSINGDHHHYHRLKVKTSLGFQKPLEAIFTNLLYQLWVFGIPWAILIWDIVHLEV